MGSHGWGGETEGGRWTWAVTRGEGRWWWYRGGGPERLEQLGHEHHVHHGGLVHHQHVARQRVALTSKPAGKPQVECEGVGRRRMGLLSLRVDFRRTMSLLKLLVSGLYSSRRCRVLAGAPVASSSRLAARPVGAARANCHSKRARKRRGGWGGEEGCRIEHRLVKGKRRRCMGRWRGKGLPD